MTNKLLEYHTKDYGHRLQNEYLRFKKSLKTQQTQTLYLPDVKHYIFALK